jgi:hypothetical protein
MWPCDHRWRSGDERRRCFRKSSFPDGGDQLARRRLGFGAELPLELRDKLVVLFECLMRAAGLGEETNQCRVRILIDRIIGDQVSERVDGLVELGALLVELGEPPEQGEVTRAEGCAATIRPVFIQVLWKQTATVSVEGRLRGSRVERSPRVPESRLKVVDIDPDELRQTEGDHLPITREKRARGSAGRLETLPSMVECDTEVVGSGSRLELRPERIDQLLTVDAVG